MTDVDTTVPDLARTPDRVGQATAIEQSRAVAEVQAAIVVAQQCPRQIGAAVTAMRESCRQPALAERAFYRFPRGGQSVQGPSVHLARELARCWGNVQYGIVELRRDDNHGQSEMQAFAWDVQTNTRSMQIFVVPHKRDKRGGPEKLVDMRDIYENNANNGARRLREAIFAIIPPWFVDEAKDLCAQTLTDGGGKPLAQRVADAAKAFEDLGVTVDQLEEKIGRPRERWNEHDVAQLTVTYKSLKRGEITVDEEFPQDRVTVAEITGRATPVEGSPPDEPDEPPPPEPEEPAEDPSEPAEAESTAPQPAPEEPPASGSSTSSEAEEHEGDDDDWRSQPVTVDQHKHIRALYAEHRIDEDTAHAFLRATLKVDSHKSMNRGQMSKLIDWLGGGDDNGQAAAAKMRSLAAKQLAEEAEAAEPDAEPGPPDDGGVAALHAAQQRAREAQHAQGIAPEPEPEDWIAIGRDAGISHGRTTVAIAKAVARHLGIDEPAKADDLAGVDHPEWHAQLTEALVRHGSGRCENYPDEACVRCRGGAS